MDDFVLKILLSAVLGIIIGFQRELKDRPAGIRTHALVAVASCIYTSLSAGGFNSGDPSRVAANVAVGIGFIGAGTIIKQGNIIVGLTTAASLWTVAAIGMLAGLKYYLLAVFAAFLVLVILVLFELVESSIGKKVKIEFSVEPVSGDLKDSSMFENIASIDTILISKSEDKIIISGSAKLRSEQEIDKFFEHLSKFGKVTKFEATLKLD